eukprot:TRINITY_DN50262_c0_g1_i1.p1 TRINITY_DN50262_c0_g1~~TRINITY_DN50262_c0_g1_i1.p1  ORF type:complete len:247 (-),score=27.33 TRINITY_DN50262_c0_g1_i1:14-754(-)
MSVAAFLQAPAAQVGISMTLVSLLPTLDAAEQLGVVNKTWHAVMQSESCWYLLCTRDNVAGVVRPQTDCADREVDNQRLNAAEVLERLRREVGADFYVPPPSDQAPSWQRLYARNVCPHLTSENIGAAEKRWSPEFKQWVCSKGRCSAEGCSAIDVMVCCICDVLGCGRAHQRHALEHYNTCGHTPTVNLRGLDVWCYRCDRFLGEEGGREAENVRNLRRALLCRDQLSQHRQGWLRDLDPLADWR